MKKKLLVSLTSALASLGVAALPASASAAELGSTGGTSYNNCARVSGDYEWTFRGDFDGLAGYTTSGTAHVRRGNPQCTLTPVLRWKGWVYTRSSSWVGFDWATLATGTGDVDLSFNGQITRGVQLKICNLQPNGTINGCATVR
ncbi:hypothetical protein ABZZ20_31740 [Streptomyces sp. NPDC006430]|uniref:hypothetical protein n=1 Tax=Streptomyces sp. NPDC006430 TaxID=3154299 RepID=UPI0033B82763